MKKKYLIFLWAFWIGNFYTASKSFFRPRDISTDSSLELSLTNYHRYHTPSDDHQPRFYFYLKPFVMGSTNTKQLTRYFLPNNKTCVTLDESGYGNIDPLWFNLISPSGSFYTSLVSLAPQRLVGGVLFTLYANITDRLWLGINTAAVQVSNSIHICEFDRLQAGTIPGFSNAYQALNNPAWQAGKICPFNLTIGGLDDIQGKIGYDFLKNEEAHISVYAVATAPTGKRPTSSFLFEPLVGSKNGSFGVGLDMEIPLCDTDEQPIALMCDLKYRYIFRTTERRSFDLCKNGDWSRYLLVVTPNELLDSQPAINLLTLPAYVTPRSTIDLWVAFTLPRGNFTLEFGYDFWWRQAEKICKKCSPLPGYGIQTLALCGSLSSASSATICQAAQGEHITETDTVFTAITQADVNLNSAAHPKALSQKFYVDLGYTFIETPLKPLVGLGVSYEFATKNALAQWGAWLTAGMTY